MPQVHRTQSSRSDHDKRLGINDLLLFGRLSTRHGSVFRPKIRPILFP